MNDMERSLETERMETPNSMLRTAIASTKAHPTILRNDFNMINPDFDSPNKL